MTKKHLIKKALIANVIALALSLSTFVGTTFAWLTDSVTSANNVITSGNLDITLEYWKDNEWKDVKARSDILSNNLWEPGYAETVYLRIQNTGDLSLKYQLGVNIVSEVEGTNLYGQTFKLSDYIYYDVKEGVNGETSSFANQDEAFAVTTQTNTISDGYKKTDVLTAQSDYVHLAMIVYMPSFDHNFACHNGINIPKINLGISIIATQYEGEKDSFDDQYDADADKDYETNEIEQSFMHISFDDVTYSFQNLSSKNYASLYDEPFFAWIKSLHDTYGAKFSLYVYDGTLNSVPNRYADEFSAAAEWLKIGIHDGGNGVYNSFANTSYADAKNYWNNFVEQVERITGGTKNIDRVPRLHYFAASKDALLGMNEAECGALGFLSADDDRISYYFNSEIRTYLYDNDHITDRSNGLVFLSTDMRGDWFTGNFSTTNRYKAPINTNVYDELVYRFSSDEYSSSRESFIFFAHEWQFYNGSTLNGYKAWTEDACKFAYDYEIGFDYPQNKTFSSTPYDILSEDGPIETEATFDGQTLAIVDDFQNVRYTNGYTINGSGLKYTALKARAVSKTEILKVSNANRKLSLDLTKLSIKDKLYYTAYAFTDLPLGSATYDNLGGTSGSWIQTDITLPSNAKYVMILFKNGNDEDFSAEDFALLNECVTFSDITNPTTPTEPVRPTTVQYHNTQMQVVDSISEMVFNPEYSISGNASSDFTKTNLNGRACCVTAILSVNGGETIDFVDNFEEIFGSTNLFWALIEFKDAPLSTATLSASSNTATGRAWLSGQHTLNANTKYVMLAFRNGDGTVDFTQAQLEKLSQCLIIR